MDETIFYLEKAEKIDPINIIIISHLVVAYVKNKKKPFETSSYIISKYSREAQCLSNSIKIFKYFF